MAHISMVATHPKLNTTTHVSAFFAIRNRI
jgi:hypothetical protein